MYAAQLIISGLASGGIYALVALGFAVIFKASGVFNFSQGEFVMISGMVAYAAYVAGFHPILAIGISLLFAAGLGWAIHYFFCRKLYNQPLFTMVILTLGIAIILKGLAGLIFGHQPKKFPMLLKSVELGKGLILGGDHLIVLLTLVIVVAPVYWFFKFTREGIAMRATAIDPLTTLMMGVNPNKTQALAWIFAGIFGGIGGGLLGCITFVSTDVGNVGLRALPAVLLGGIDSPNGVVIAGLLLGITENLFLGYFGQYFGGDVREAFAYAVLLIVLILMPQGLFGTRTVSRA